jgi:hypothetical protein
VIKEIIACGTPEAARDCFLRHVQEEIEPHDYRGKNLIHVFVQDEELFLSILKVFTALNAHSVTVVEANDPRMYLSAMPPFSGLWVDQNPYFCRLIVAALNKKLTNEAIRRIEQLAGPLDDCESVFLSVQEVFYTTGALVF